MGIWAPLRLIQLLLLFNRKGINELWRELCKILYLGVEHKRQIKKKPFCFDVAVIFPVKSPYYSFALYSYLIRSLEKERNFFFKFQLPPIPIPKGILPKEQSQRSWSVGYQAVFHLLCLPPDGEGGATEWHISYSSSEKTVKTWWKYESYSNREGQKAIAWSIDHQS